MTHHTIAILDDYQSVALTSADWSPILASGCTIDVFTDTLPTEDALAHRLQKYSIICAMRERTKFPASLLDRLPNLKLLATTGMVNRGIDVEYARRKGVVVCGTGGKGNSTLEHIWALILGTARCLSVEDANIKAGNPQWQTQVPFGLAGKTLGLVGLGRLGKQVAAIAQAFSMNITAWSPNLTQPQADAANVLLSPSKSALFASADIVSVHMVLSERTHHLITASDLALLLVPRPGSNARIFINTSRGPLVDEEALVRVLRESEGFVRAGLDVFDVEPLPLDHPLRDLGNVTLSPHVGYVSDSNYEAFWGDTVENIGAFLSGSPKRVMGSAEG